MKKNKNQSQEKDENKNDQQEIDDLKELSDLLEADDQEIEKYQENDSQSKGGRPTLGPFTAKVNGVEWDPDVKNQR